MSDGPSHRTDRIHGHVKRQWQWKPWGHYQKWRPYSLVMAVKRETSPNLLTSISTHGSSSPQWRPVSSTVRSPRRYHLTTAIIPSSIPLRASSSRSSCRYQQVHTWETLDARDECDCSGEGSQHRFQLSLEYFLTHFSEFAFSLSPFRGPRHCTIQNPARYHPANAVFCSGSTNSPLKLVPEDPVISKMYQTSQEKRRQLGYGLERRLNLCLKTPETRSS